jgi:hypothetical protein
MYFIFSTHPYANNSIEKTNWVLLTNAFVATLACREFLTLRTVPEASRHPGTKSLVESGISREALAMSVPPARLACIYSVGSVTSSSKGRFWWRLA